MNQIDLSRLSTAVDTLDDDQFTFEWIFFQHNSILKCFEKKA
jgi:hypothetical protein